MYLLLLKTPIIYYLKGLAYRGTTYYGIHLIENSSETDDGIPENWEENVIAIVDEVPIPKGFVASQATGENTKNGGLVIYEGTTAVTDENVEQAKRGRNQYVWVPVESKDFVNKFIRQNFGLDRTISNVLGSDYWEVVLDKATNIPHTTQDETYMTTTTLAEVQAMYASVKEYGGFYVARYEAGLDVQRKSSATEIVTGSSVHSKMGKIPYTFIQWCPSTTMNDDKGGAVEVARSLYPNNSTNVTGVVSTLMYGVQWDRTLAWWLEVGAKTGSGNTITSVASSTYGNYSDHVINSAEDLNDDALVCTTNFNSSYVEKNSSTLTYPKSSGTGWALSTGALESAKVNNIYDMAGNMYEWTMEGHSNNLHVYRGGYYGCSGGDYPVAFSGTIYPYIGTDVYAFRPALYIKK